METVFLGLFLFGTLFTVVSVVLGFAGLELGHSQGGGAHGADALHAGTAHQHPPVMHHPGHGADAAQPSAHQAGDHGGPLPLLNGSTLLAFVTWFGAAGFVVLRFTGLPLLAALAIALPAGLAGALLIARFLKLVLAGEKVMNPAEYQLEGTIARVSSGIPAGGAGEIVFSMGGRRRSEAARTVNGAPAPRNTEVVIIEYQHGTATVQPWSEFVRRTPPAAPSAE